MTFEKFLENTHYIDYLNPAIQSLSETLFADAKTDVKKASIAFHFVRDKIPHSFDIESDLVPVTASEVLTAGTGICHAKANLLAALLRSQNIPAGFCFEHITLASDEKLGYCVHGFNAAYVAGRWIQLDARGNLRIGVCAEFSLEKFYPAFVPRDIYDEYFYPGVYAEPHTESMQILERANSRQDIIEMIAREFTGVPDVGEEELYKISP